MTVPDHVRVTRFRPWVAVAAGMVVGIALAAAAVLAWPGLVRDRSGPGEARSRPDTSVDLFRATDAARQIVLVRSGPDATGEPALAAGLFPGEDPAREIASVLLVNADLEAPWSVDLGTEPIRGRVSAEAPWEELSPLAPERADGLEPALALRFRALAGGGAQIDVAPGSLRRVLLALPAGRTISQLSDVQWGDRPLVRESVDVETFHALRDADPAEGRGTPRR